MKRKVSDYGDFCSAVQNNRLVYLFGTGISSSLTGKVYSWKKWIVDGTGYISDAARAEEIRDSIKADDSTGNLLAKVKSVLEITKKEGIFAVDAGLVRSKPCNESFSGGDTEEISCDTGYLRNHKL